MRALVRVGGLTRQGPGLISDKREYIAHENQTVFDITYAPGNIDVYRNGLRLHHTDYVADDGETVVLLNECAEGDIVALSGGGVAVVPGSYSRHEVDSLLNGKAAVSHSHQMSDVSGLNAALNGKAAVSHSHQMSDVTGLSGALGGKAQLNATSTVSGGLKARLSGTTLYLSNNGTNP